MMPESNPPTVVTTGRSHGTGRSPQWHYARGSLTRGVRRQVPDKSSQEELRRQLDRQGEHDRSDPRHEADQGTDEQPFQ